MAALTSPNNVQFAAAPDPALVEFQWIALSKASSADTVDLAPIFSTVAHAMFLNRTTPGHAAGAIAGTVVTVPAGWTNDSGFIAAFGR